MLVSDMLITPGEKSFERKKIGLTLNSNGVIINHQKYKDNTVHSSVNYTYNSVGQISSRSTVDADGNMFQSDSLQYNLLGLIASKKTYLNTGTLRHTSLFEYDLNHRIKSQKEINFKRDTSETKYMYNVISDSVVKITQSQITQNVLHTYWIHTINNLDVAKYLYDYKLGRKPSYRNVYDNQKRLIKQTLFASNGKPESVHLFHYKQDKCIEEHITNLMEGTTYLINRTYNRKGLLTEEIGRFSLSSETDYHFKLRYNCKKFEKKLTTFKPDGSPKTIQKKWYRNGLLERIKHFDAEGHYYTVNYNYTYYEK